MWIFRENVKSKKGILVILKHQHMMVFLGIPKIKGLYYYIVLLQKTF